MPPPSSNKEVLNLFISRIQDPKWFIESSFFIVDKRSLKVPFVFNHAQNLYYANRTRRDIILKARKEGFSTLLIALWIHACAFQDNQRAVLVSHEEKSTERLLDRAEYLLKNSVFPIKYKRTGNTLKFPETNSEFWIGTAGARNFGRGDDLTHVHASELAFYDDNSILTAVSEAMRENATLVVETTANGGGTPFHEMWKRARNKESEYIGHFIPWFWDKGYTRKCVEGPFELTPDEMKLKEMFKLSWEQMAWHRWKPTDMPEPDKFHQEYPSTPDEAFLSTGRMVFDWAAVKKLEDSAIIPKWRGGLIEAKGTVELELDDAGLLTIWRVPENGTAYLITADAADGVVGNAFSVADVFDMNTWEQVAQFRGHPDPMQFAENIRKLGFYYNWALIAVERKYPGNATIAQLENKQYPNLYRDRKLELGFDTNYESKAAMVSAAREAVRELRVKLHSRATFNELRSFIVNNNTGKYEPQKGCWQDCVIVLSAACFILNSLSDETISERKQHFHDIYPYRSKFGSSSSRYDGGNRGARVV